MSLEIGTKLVGLSTADPAALGLVEAPDGLAEGASDGVPDGDAPVQPLTASINATPASLLADGLVIPAESDMLRSLPCATAAGMRSIDLAVGTKVDQERFLAFPAEQNAEIVVDAEGPVRLELSLQLVGAQQGVLGIGGKPAQRRTQH